MSKLSKFLVADATCRTSGMFQNTSNPILVVDFHNISYRNLHGIPKSAGLNDEEFFQYWKTITLQSLNKLLKKFKPKSLVVVVDDTDSWRKEYYPEYKATRKTTREASTIDFNRFFKVMDEFLESFKNHFHNVYLIKVPRCEGDDVIGVLVMKTLAQHQCIVASSDSDFQQLASLKNFQQYRPIEGTMFKLINGDKYLLRKIIIGDFQSDNIPGIKRGLGPKTADKLITSGTLDKFLKENQLEKIFERNKTLIDFKSIPTKYVNAIDAEFKNYNLRPYNARGLMNFIQEQNLTNLFNQLQGFVESFKPLQGV